MTEIISLFPCVDYIIAFQGDIRNIADSSHCGRKAGIHISGRSHIGSSRRHRNLSHHTLYRCRNGLFRIFGDRLGNIRKSIRFIIVGRTARHHQSGLRHSGYHARSVSRCLCKEIGFGQAILAAVSHSIDRTVHHNVNTIVSRCQGCFLTGPYNRFSVGSAGCHLCKLVDGNNLFQLSATKATTRSSRKQIQVGGLHFVFILRTGFSSVIVSICRRTGSCFRHAVRHGNGHCGISSRFFRILSARDVRIVGTGGPGCQQQSSQPHHTHVL